MHIHDSAAVLRHRQPITTTTILKSECIYIFFFRDRMEEEGLALPDDYPRSFDDMPKGLTTEELMEEDGNDIDNDKVK